MQPRAKKGGELGVNNEWYEGGKFLPSLEDRPKHQVNTTDTTGFYILEDDNGKTCGTGLVDLLNIAEGDYTVLKATDNTCTEFTQII